MSYVWEDLPKRVNTFTVRNAASIDLRTKKPRQYYSNNTKIVVVQKCVTDTGTYYRTESAVRQGLDLAFEAQALGLPNEKAPSVLLPSKLSSQNQDSQNLEKNKKVLNNTALTKDGESLQEHRGIFAKMFSLFKNRHK